MTRVRKAGETLTPAEMRVFDMMAYGMSPKEIAADIGCSFRTIHIHKSNIMNKLLVNDACRLVRMSMTRQIREKIDAIEHAVLWGKRQKALTEIRDINAFLGDER